MVYLNYALFMKQELSSQISIQIAWHFHSGYLPRFSGAGGKKFLLVHSIVVHLCTSWDFFSFLLICFVLKFWKSSLPQLAVIFLALL